MDKIISFPFSPHPTSYNIKHSYEKKSTSFKKHYAKTMGFCLFVHVSLPKQAAIKLSPKAKFL